MRNIKNDNSENEIRTSRSMVKERKTMSLDFDGVRINHKAVRAAINDAMRK
jgi:hypothetical protein